MELKQWIENCKCKTKVFHSFPLFWFFFLQKNVTIVAYAQGALNFILFFKPRECIKIKQKKVKEREKKWGVLLNWEKEIRVENQNHSNEIRVIVSKIIRHLIVLKERGVIVVKRNISWSARRLIIS